ncbi:MAG: HNH endonuclease [Chloroflexi bacterium]|nr:HNH endonuclease [Chloroflexota bacterium]
MTPPGQNKGRRRGSGLGHGGGGGSGASQVDGSCGNLWTKNNVLPPSSRSRRGFAKLQGRKSLLYLWRSQNGVCPICGEKIDEEIGWDNHHIEWRVHGGSDTMDNRVLLHPACHRQAHCLG